MSEITKLKIEFIAVITAVGAWFDTVWEYFAFALAAMLIDYITGMLAGRANEGLKSKKAVSGFYKKMGMLVLLFLGFLIDGFVNHYLGQGFAFDLPFNLPIGLVVSGWVFITEAISILENLQRMGVPVPKFLLNFLKKGQEKINNNNESEENKNVKNQH